MLNVTSVRKNHPFISQLDCRTGSITRNFISIPIIIDSAVRGGILVANKIANCEGSNSSTQPWPWGVERQDNGTVFGSLDEVLLGFIAVNVGLAIRSTVSNNKKLKPKSTSLSLTMDRSPRKDVGSPLQLLVDRARDQLDADLVSVFAYNDVTKCLESTVSNDSTDFSIPIDKGIAGTTFRMGRVINIQETESDERYNRDLDAQIGYKTQSLLCAPIMDSSGRPVGVIQALNKRSMPHFSRNDESLICGLCSQAFSLLHDVDFLSEYATNYNASLVVKLLSAVISSTSITSMVAEVRHLIMDVVTCDYVGIYTFIIDSAGDHLICHNTPLEQSDKNIMVDKILLAKIPLEILDALKTGMMTEMSVPGKSSKKNLLECFLPGIMARHALVYPLQGDMQACTDTLLTEALRPNNDGRLWRCNSVLVVVRNNQSCQPFHAASRDVLELFVAVLGAAIEHVVSRQLQDSAIVCLENNFLLANSTLGSLQDHIVLLSAGGQVVAWNRDLSTLLGEEEDEIEMLHTSTSMEIDGDHSSRESWMRSRNKDEGMEAPRRQHFSRWFKRSNCVELAVDIAHATDLNRMSCPLHISKNAVFTSSEYPLGISIDYQLLSKNTKGSINDGEANNVVLIIRKSNDVDYITASTKSLPKRVDSDSATPTAMCEITDARKLVEAATLLLKSIGSKYSVASYVQSELDVAAGKMQQLIESLYPARPSINMKKDKDKSVERMGLVNIEIALPGNLFSWDFNALEFDDKAVLVNSIGKIFESLQLLDVLGICPMILANFLREISVKYHDNPFHNLHHATCVTQFAYMLINATDAVKYLSPQQLFGVVLSAVVHDVDHPGNTNMFEINSQSYLSLLYNDQSVLENHHCSTAFQLMRKPSSNILKGLVKATALEMRKTIVSCVMATDMSVHFQLVDETKKIVVGGDYSFSEAQDQMFLCKLLVHSADLSNPVRPFHITQAWARRISAEFNLQVAMEQELNMPVLNFMMTPDDKALCKNETGFASFVVAPMWRSLSGLFPGLTPLVQQLDSNLSNWKSMLDKIMRDEEAERGVQ